MRWLAVSLSLCAAVVAIEQRCEHPNCSGSGWGFRSYGKAQFTVEGHTLEFGYKGIKADEIAERLFIDCGGFQTFDSAALPRFASPFRVPYIFLTNCPLPSNSSLGDVFAALNVVLQPSGVKEEEEVSLFMDEFPAVKLTAHHFVGLDEVTFLKIDTISNVKAQQRPLPDAGFLTGLQKLMSLHIVGVRLPAGEISRLPQSLKYLWLCGESLNFLPATLPEILIETKHFLPKLELLMLDQYQFSAPEFANLTTSNLIQTNAPSVLKSIHLQGWKDRRIVPFEQCHTLRAITIYRAKVEEFSDRLVAACPLLEELTVDIAEALTSLPATLLEGATSLKRLTITRTKIRTLPSKLLEGAPNLVEVDLSRNQILRFPSDVFLGPALQVLNLERNRLNVLSMPAIAPLTSLTKLYLGENHIFELCEKHGYSPLKNLTNLKELSLKANTIHHICRDWRENLIFLKSLDLFGANIQILQSTDFLFTRDESVKDAEVKLSTSLYNVNFTRADYDLALAAPGPGVTFKIGSEWRYPDRKIDCDCSASWLRRAVDANRVIKIEGLPCNNGRAFKDMTPEEMCPESEHK